MPDPAEAALSESVAQLRSWLTEAAWPLWRDHGVDPGPDGSGFREALTLEGLRCPADFRRLRVVTRQTYVFAQATEAGLPGARALTEFGIGWLRRHAARPDGGYAWRFDLHNTVTDDRRDLYDHAFTLLAFSAAAGALPQADFRPEALALLGYIDRRFPHPAGGYLESLPPALPRRQNPHMHLLEALLAAYEAFGDSAFLDRASGVIDLFVDHLLDPATRALPEYFDDDLAIQRQAGRFLVEPGHHCEWAWLLTRYARLSGTRAAEMAGIAGRLMAFVDRHGLSAEGAVIDEVWSDGCAKSTGAKLWPQTERIKAEFLRPDPTRARQAQAARVLLGYLRPDGLWSEYRGGPAGVTDTAPASSLYHLTCGILTACEAAG